MKTMKTGIPLLISALAATFFAGCAETYYISNNELILGDPTALTQSEKKVMAEEAVELLRRDPTFIRVYEAKKTSLAKEAKEQGKEPPLPLIAMDGLHNLTGNGASDSRELGQVSRFLQTRLRQTDLFDVTDDFIGRDLLERLLAGVTVGETDGLAGVGDYHAPDLWLTGELRKETDGPIHTFLLNLQLMDTATKRFFWSNTIEKRKTR